MPTELSVLDMAEMGDLHGSSTEEDCQRQVDGREINYTLRSEPQPSEVVAEAQDAGLGEFQPLPNDIKS